MMILRLIGVVGVLSFVSISQAQENVEPERAPDPAITAASVGSYLPETLSARVGATPAFAYGSGGYDSSRHGPLVNSAVEVTIWGPFAIRAQATYSNDTG